MRPWTSAIGIVVSSLSSSPAPDCANKTLERLTTDSRRVPILAWFIVFLLFSRFVDNDDSRDCLTISLLLGRITTIASLCHGSSESLFGWLDRHELAVEQKVVGNFQSSGDEERNIHQTRLGKHEPDKHRRDGGA